MQYTLITKSGKVMQFFIRAVAETYQQGLGGVVFTADILQAETVAANEIVDGLAV
jgi:hypothetical protein